MISFKLGLIQPNYYFPVQYYLFLNRIVLRLFIITVPSVNEVCGDYSFLLLVPRHCVSGQAPEKNQKKRTCPNDASARSEKNKKISNSSPDFIGKRKRLLRFSTIFFIHSQRRPAVWTGRRTFFLRKNEKDKQRAGFNWMRRDFGIQKEAKSH